MMAMAMNTHAIMAAAWKLIRVRVLLNDDEGCSLFRFWFTRHSIDGAAQHYPQ